MNELDQIEVIECPICMFNIEGNTNKVSTDCGHCFHAKCLFKNVSHNGFKCPLCRTTMLDPEQEEEQEEDEEEEEEEEDEEVTPPPPIEYIVQKMEEQGFTLERLIKPYLAEHDEYNAIEDECLQEGLDVWESLRIIISNFEPHEANNEAQETSTHGAKMEQN